MENKKYTLITGASAGIGYAAAIAFSARHKNLILVARREANLKKIKAEIQKQEPALDIIIKICDLSEPKNVYKLYHELKPYSIETLINSAGLGDYSSVANESPDKITAMLRLNIEALTMLSTYFVKDYYYSIL